MRSLCHRCVRPTYWTRLNIKFVHLLAISALPFIFFIHTALTCRLWNLKILKLLSQIICLRYKSCSLNLCRRLIRTTDTTSKWINPILCLTYRTFPLFFFLCSILSFRSFTDSTMSCSKCVFYCTCWNWTKPFFLLV